MTAASDSPQVGDTVRLTIPTVIEGQVWEDTNGRTRVSVYYLDGQDRTVEILERATPPLPSEPGTYWLDKQGDVWEVGSDGDPRCPGSPFAKPALYAPFRQLVVAE